jgi:hypothetical protein
MAGTLVITTLSDGTNSTSATNCIQGSAKAWVNFNGVTTVTIRASYNVSSVTRNSLGNYTVNFTNAFVDANYNFNGTSSRNTMGNLGSIFNVQATPTASALTFATWTAAGATIEDSLYTCVSVWR